MVIDEKENSGAGALSRDCAPPALPPFWPADACAIASLASLPRTTISRPTRGLKPCRRLFDHTVAVGARFGVIMVILGDHHFEVATFRADAEYLDGRRPSSVRFGTIEEDVQRRDFTIGGMYFDPATDRVIDLVGGCAICARVSCARLATSMPRFEEDHLRMLRALRFAARLDFAIDPATYAAIKRSAPSIAHTSAERIGEEIVMIMTEGGAARGIDLLVESGLAELVMPELLALPSCPQPENFHPEGDVYRHTRLMLSMLPRGCTETLAFGTLAA